MSHLTDEQLQAYLDGGFQHQQPEIENHLAQCSNCRTQLAAYRQVYRAASTVPHVAFSAQFADIVITRITARQNKLATMKRNLSRLLAGMLIGSIMLFLFIRYKVGMLLFQLLIKNVTYFSIQLQLLGNNSDSSILLIASAALILVILWLSDCIFPASKQNDALTSQ